MSFFVVVFALLLTTSVTYGQQSGGNALNGAPFLSWYSSGANSKGLNWNTANLCVKSSGHLPPFACSTFAGSANGPYLITQFGVNSNSFTGTLPFPTQWLAATAINTVSFITGPTGALPTSWGAWQSTLTQLVFVNSPITDIGSAISQLTTLQYLSFSAPSITTIPTQLGLLKSQLNTLIIDFAPKLTGTIPTQLAQLSALNTLDLHQNALTGTIPTQFTVLTNLVNLNLNTNSISGPIPSQLSWLTNLAQLNLGVNDLTGSIPTEIGLLTSLTFLDLDTNLLSGPIPTYIGLDTLLEYVDVSHNQLSGTFPTEIGILTSLTYLAIDVNSISGPIPTQFENVITANIAATLLDNAPSLEFYANNNSLSGHIPSYFAPTSALTSGGLVIFEDLFLENNQFCPYLDYTSWGVNTDTPGPACSAGIYYVYTVTSDNNPAHDGTKSSLQVKFSGSLGSTSWADLVPNGFAAGSVVNTTVYADVDVGIVWTIFFSYGNPADKWVVDDIIVTHNGLDSEYKSHVAIRHQDLLETTFYLTVNTIIAANSFNYAVLRDSVGRQQNYVFPPNSITNGTAFTAALLGYNLDDLNVLYLGQYSSSLWTVSDATILKRGATSTFFYSSGISKFNRPVEGSLT